MKKEKLQLTSLRINSFITELNTEYIKTVKGGGSETRTKNTDCNTYAKGCDTLPAYTIVTDSFDNNACSQQNPTGPFTNCNNGTTVSRTVD